MSACMRSLYSSDQWAPGFWLTLLCGWGGGVCLLSLVDLRAPAFSLSVTRGDVGLEDEFELFMQFLGTYFSLLRCSYGHAPPDLRSQAASGKNLSRRSHLT